MSDREVEVRAAEPVLEETTLIAQGLLVTAVDRVGDLAHLGVQERDPGEQFLVRTALAVAPPRQGVAARASAPVSATSACHSASSRSPRIEPEVSSTNIAWAGTRTWLR